MSQPYTVPRSISGKHVDALVTECLVVAPNGVEVLTTDATGALSTTAAVASSGAVTSASPSGGIGYAVGAGGTVTQITNSATAVTINKITGTITTVSLTTAAGAEEEFTCNNSTVTSSDCVVLTPIYGGAGTPAVTVKSVGSGTFVINITNLHAANALNGVVQINFVVIRGTQS